MDIEAAEDVRAREPGVARVLVGRRRNRGALENDVVRKDDVVCRGVRVAPCAGG